MRPVLFLDLDGTVRRSRTGKFIQDIFDIEIMPGRLTRMKLYRNKGFYLAAVTNQGGVAFGIKTLQDVRDELKATNELLDGLFNTMIFCPYHPDGNIPEFSVYSPYRKPGPGMIFSAAEKIKAPIDWQNSLLVGDMETDKQCAELAGISFSYAKDFFKT